MCISITLLCDMEGNSWLIGARHARWQMTNWGWQWLPWEYNTFVVNLAIMHAYNILLANSTMSCLQKALGWGGIIMHKDYILATIITLNALNPHKYVSCKSVPILKWNALQLGRPHSMELPVAKIMRRESRAIHNIVYVFISFTQICCKLWRIMQ